ncbi:MAG: leucyl/phenylalanyl-tRNA--protein transferase [Bdellovibrionales bacterium]|nr:leucyl/phenylalanyl-tRNA--protein transferase [Bdellovibrionales bacterium]
MVVVDFPPVSMAREDGLLAFGGDTDPESLLLAYRQGIFPWPVADDLLTWFAPPERAILRLENYHPSRSLKKKLRQLDYELKTDQAFALVMSRCAELVNRGKQSGTWITPEILSGYQQLHEQGNAHSVECYAGEELIGGIYGVSIGSYVAAESMFYRQPYASQFALFYLVELLKKQKVKWLDCQVMSPHLATFGVESIAREEFMTLLADAIQGPEIEWNL